MIYGIGINDANYVVKKRIGSRNGNKAIRCPYYRVWHSMMSRCYSTAFHRRNPAYIGCSVDSRWHNFMAFRAWMLTQDWENKQLDKDIINFGNKIYSPETCCFISEYINKMLRPRSTTPLPGVRQHGRKFIASITANGKRQYLGLHNSAQAAFIAYCVAKNKIIRSMANEQKDPRIRNGLLNHIPQRLFT